MVPAPLLRDDMACGPPGNRSQSCTVIFKNTATGSDMTLIHDGWENLGEDGAHLRENYNSGWNAVLADFRNLIAEPAV